MNEVTRLKLFGDGSMGHGVGAKVTPRQALDRLLGVETPAADTSAPVADAGLPVADAHPTTVGPAVDDAAAPGGLMDAIRRAVDGDPVALSMPAEADDAAEAVVQHADDAPPLAGTRRNQIAQIRTALSSGGPKVPIIETNRLPGMAVGDEAAARLAEVGGEIASRRGQISEIFRVLRGGTPL